MSCIRGYRYDISWRNIGPAKFREKSQKIGDILRYIGDYTKEENIAICRISEGIAMIFHGEISVWQNFGRNPKKSAISRDISAIFPINHMVNNGQIRYNAWKIILLLRGFEPFGLGFNPLTIRAHSPLLYIMH